MMIRCRPYHTNEPQASVVIDRAAKAPTDRDTIAPLYTYRIP